MYLSKSMKVLASKCTWSIKSKSTKCLKIADLQAHNASPCDALWACRSAIFKHFCTFTFDASSTFWCQHFHTFTQVHFKSKTFTCSGVFVHCSIDTFTQVKNLNNLFTTLPVTSVTAPWQRCGRSCRWVRSPASPVGSSPGVPGRSWPRAPELLLATAVQSRHNKHQQHAHRGSMVDKERTLFTLLLIINTAI